MCVQALGFEAKPGEDLDELVLAAAGDLAGGFVLGAMVVVVDGQNLRLRSCQTGCRLVGSSMSSSAAMMVKELPRAAKLQLMEELWDDLSHDPEDVTSPEWHGEVLAARSAKVADGTAEFFDWELVKASLLRPRS